jgi:hypothetical protein
LEASRLHLERARDHEGGSETAWCALLAGGVPRQGVVVEEGVKSPMPAKIHKNGTKNRQFPALIDLKIAENTFFA